MSIKLKKIKRNRKERREEWRGREGKKNNWKKWIAKWMRQNNFKKVRRGGEERKRKVNKGWGREVRGEVGWRELYLSTQLWFLWNNVNISNGNILSNREQKLERNIKSYNSKGRRMWLPLSNHSLISHLYFSSSGAILLALNVQRVFIFYAWGKPLRLSQLAFQRDKWYVQCCTLGNDSSLMTHGDFLIQVISGLL